MQDATTVRQAQSASSGGKPSAMPAAAVPRGESYPANATSVLGAPGSIVQEPCSSGVEQVVAAAIAAKVSCTIVVANSELEATAKSLLAAMADGVERVVRIRNGLEVPALWRTRPAKGAK